MADALATALSVMGPEEGLAWVEAHDIVALFISRRSDSSLEPVESSAYARYMASE